MAYKDGKMLSYGEEYNLGKYTFGLTRTFGDENTEIRASCYTDGDVSNAVHKDITVPGTVDVESWYVDANSNTADVYATYVNTTFTGPSKILVTTPPTKTTYDDGEQIDFSGIVVTAYNKDGTVWTSEDYPDGTIPFEEILPSIRKARPEGRIKTSDLGIRVKDTYFFTSEQFPITTYLKITRWSNQDHYGSPYTNEHSYTFGPFTPRYTGNDGGRRQVGFLIKSNSQGRYEGYDQIRCWGGIDSTVYRYESDGYYYYNEFYVHKHKSVNLDGPYYAGATNLEIYDHSRNIYEELMFESNLPIMPNDIGSIGQVLWTILYGDDSFYSTITLYWQRPEDGKVLSCTFEINVESENAQIGE